MRAAHNRHHITPEEKAHLAQLWSEGHSYRQIGKRMSMSWQQISGYVSRANLPPRPSPIQPAAPVPLSVSGVHPERVLAGSQHEPLAAFHPLALAVLRGDYLAAGWECAE